VADLASVTRRSDRGVPLTQALAGLVDDDVLRSATENIVALRYGSYEEFRIYELETTLDLDDMRFTLAFSDDARVAFATALDSIGFRSTYWSPKDLGSTYGRGGATTPETKASGFPGDSPVLDLPAAPPQSSARGASSDFGL